jgi:SRSO17 transposase
MKFELQTGLKYLRPHEISNSMHEELLQQEQLFDKCFKNQKTKESARTYFHGLISSVERKNSWQLAEHTGCENPYAFQYLLGRASWEEDKLRDLSRSYTIDHLGSSNSVISVDESGFLKKGLKSAGVARQYSGTAGRVENCQIGVFLSYSTDKGRALIDRELYIPQEWFKDDKRRIDADIPESITFKKKPQLALEMLKRTFENNIKPTWVVGDEVYGCYSLRSWLEENQQQYAMAVPNNYPISIGFDQYKAKYLLEKFADSEWKMISAGKGTKGERFYKWCRIKINSDSPDDWDRWLVLRKNIKDSTDIAYYIAFVKETNSLESTVKAIGSRWTIEICQSYCLHKHVIIFNPLFLCKNEPNFCPFPSIKLAA